MNKMKKNFLMFAALVVSVVISFTMTACSSSDDVLDDTEEEYPTLGESIKAQFTISIPTEAKGVTRQTSDIVNAYQSIDYFRGINFIKLYPSALLPESFNGGASDKIIGRNIALTHLIIPGNTTVNNYIPGQQLLSNSNSVLYGDVQLQIGTRTFLFYGMAIGKNKEANALLTTYTPNDKFINGFLNQNHLEDEITNVSGISFSPEPITTTSKSNTKRTAILAYLNDIAGTTAGTTAWSEYGNAGFHDLYTSFTSMRAGSSTNLQVAIKDLYFALKDNKDPMAIAICDKIKNDTYVTIGDGTLVFKDNIAGYPATTDFLPDGAAVLTWTGSAFDYTVGKVSTSDMDVTSLENYVYPACLYYWGKSGILTSEESKQSLFKATKDDNTTPRLWSDIANATNFANGNAITSRTRSVVLTEPVQYAVGRLDISVTASGAKLSDKSTGVNAHEVTASNLKLTGILIGRQKSVDWKFEPISSSAESTIYDNIEVSNAAAGGLALQTSHESVLNHTLVLESTGKEGNIEDNVKIALEFVNNDVDFIGATGIVPKGTKFYLVGELNAGAANVTAADYAKTGGKVFKQDFITRAKFTIASLQTAINTIPDLRNPQVELGLSVDLSWKEGIDFDITIN